MFSVGDRVRVVKPKYGFYGYYPEIEGLEGEIVYKNVFHAGIGVDFNFERGRFHYLGNRLSRPTGRWFNENELELVLDKQIDYIEDEEYLSMIV